MVGTLKLSLEETFLNVLLLGNSFLPKGMTSASVKMYLTWSKIIHFTRKHSITSNTMLLKSVAELSLPQIDQEFVTRSQFQTVNKMNVKMITYLRAINSKHLKYICI